MTLPDAAAQRATAVPLGPRRGTRLHGADAADWSSDLLTAEVRELAVGEARGAMLLTPTGRIRAVVTVARPGDDLLLVQDEHQPEDIAALLAPYVLSSDVELVREAVVGAAVPDASVLAPGVVVVAPSLMGSGVDVLVEDEAALERALGGGATADGDALEPWRIEAGLARFPVDLGTDALPHEVDHGDMVEEHRGCYLGQEAVARVRNLGHPPWVVLALRLAEPAVPGTALRHAGDAVGRITSVSGSAAIARVRWAARKGPLTDDGGAPVGIRGRAGLLR